MRILELIMDFAGILLALLVLAWGIHHLLT